MLGRIGGAAVALGLIVALPHGLAQERIEPALEGQPIAEPGQDARAEQGEAHTAEEEPEPGGIESALKAIEGAIRDLVAEEDAIERERQEQRKVADLEAQQDMARWAEGVMWATWASVGLTFVAIVLIWRTLIHTRRAADAAADTAIEARKSTDAAVRATQAAVDSNTLNREIFIASKRAWIGVRQDNLKIASPLKWTKHGGTFILEISARNSGQYPAYGVALYSQMYMHLEERPSISELRKTARHNALAFYSNRTIFPGDVAPLRLQITVSHRAIDDYAAFVSMRSTKPVSPDSVYLHPMLLGCIDYGVISKEDRRATIFDVMFMKRADNNFIIREEGAIPAERLAAVLQMVGAD